MKVIKFVGNSKQTIRNWPKPARAVAGYGLDRVQRGKMPDDYKPFPQIGSGVIELRIKTGNEYRVIYTAKQAGAIYVLHAFVKKTMKTSRHDIEIARRNFQQIDEVK